MIEFIRRRWRDAPLAAKGGVVILFMIAAVMLASIVGIRSAVANAEARTLVLDSISARREINGVLADVSIAMAEHYSFLIVGEDEYLGRSRKHFARADERLASLTHSFPKESLQLRRVDEARDKLSDIADIADESAARAQKMGVFPSPNSADEVSGWMRESENLLALINEILVTEQGKLDERLRNQADYRNQSYYSFGAAVLFALLGGMTMGLVFTRGVVSRINAIGNYAVAHAAGEEDAVLEDQGGDELGLVARRLRAATELAHQRDREAKETQARLQAIMDHTKSLIYVKSLDGRYLFTNRQFELINGPLYGNVIGKTNYDFLDQETAKRIEEEEQKLLQSGEATEQEETYRLPDGERTFLIIRFCIPDSEGKPQGYCAVANDITLRKLALRQVQAAKDELERRVEERTRELAQANDALQVEIEERKRINNRINQQLFRMQLLNQITKAISGRHDLASLFNVVLLNLRSNLSIDLGVIFFFEEASNILLVGAHLESDSKLREELQFEEGQVLSVGQNGMLRCVKGFAIHEPKLSENDPGVFGSLARSGIRSAVASPLRVNEETLGVLLVGSKSESAFTSGDTEFQVQLGDHIALALAQIRILDSLKRAYGDLKVTQDYMSQQERLRAMGQMASGIAHDINNTLGPISLYCELLLEEHKLDEMAFDYVTTILKASEDIAKTVAGLRHFYRPQEDITEVSKVDLNALIESVIHLTKPRWSDMLQSGGKTIDVELVLSEKPPVLHGSESDLRNALTNLVFNAVDAMADGGRLTIRTFVSEDDAIIEVSDTGVGMDEATRLRCMEPFFTTKGESGTGLGLAMVYGILKRHRGQVEIDSTPGAGTTFRLIFPLKALESVVREVTVVPSRPRRVLNVLCVDDDAAIRTTLNDVLRTDGHRVTLAESGPMALQICGQEECPFDVVITDLGMPRMDGRELAGKLRERWPNLPIVLLTGWGSQLREQTEQWTVFTEVLAKPPRLNEIRAALAKATIQAPS